MSATLFPLLYSNSNAIVFILLLKPSKPSIFMAESVSKCFCFFFLFLLCSSAESSMTELQGMKKDRSFPSSRRELSYGFNAVLHDTNALPTTPENPSPIIVTVPATNPTNPVTVTPANPSVTPLPIPTTTPVAVPSTNPNNPTVPITNPVTTPVTNPVTTYPSPVAGGGSPVAGGGVPVTTPVTNPIPPPAATNAPAIPGQSWCVARTGAPETALQSALDYACGIAGADCSQIQQGGSCYNPITLENHASYAFNSYYQRNPVPTSCDFGGTAVVVATNPSSGSCIYPSSATAASTPTPVTTPSTATPTPITTPSTATPTPITTPSTATTPGYGTPPSVLNSSTPGSSTTTIPGFDTPPSINSSSSMSSRLRPFISYIILVASFIAGAIILA